MKRKRILIIITIICLLIAVGIGVGAWFVKNKKEVISEKNVKHEECDFTRYEWMELLCEKVGITDYESNTSYFEDVATDNKYFSYVQAAVEWEVLEDDDQFYGDYCASGEFIAMTSIKTVSKEKIGVYLNYDEEITDEKYLEIALELKLISEEELNKCFSLIEAQMVIERLEGLCFGIFWKEDYEKIKLAENVSEIFKEEVLEINNDGSEIVVSQNTLEELKIGQTVIFDYGNTGLKCAREVIGIEKDGTISLGEDVKLEDAFEEIIVSDVKELTFEDIANYYGVDVQETDGFVNTKIYDKEINSKGFKINLEINDENELSIKITDNKSGCWFDLPVDIALEKGVECEVELDIDKINVGAQVNYEVIRGLKSADVALESHANISGDIQGFSVEKRITLYETVTPIGTGYVGVDIGVYLVLSAEGTIHFETEIPMDAAVNYEKGKGIKKHSFNMDVENPLIEGDCTAGISVQFEPTLVILMIIDVVDVQTDVGIGAHANVKIRPGTLTCTDISVFYPTFKVSICGDDDADTLLGLLGVSAEWEIITEDNAPCKLHLHHEILANGKMQFVDECTYVEDEEEKTTEEEIVTEKETTPEKETVSETETKPEKETVTEETESDKETEKESEKETTTESQTEITTEVDELTWKIKEGVLYISGRGEIPNYKSSNVPWKKEKFTYVVIEEGITSIGANAFAEGVFVEHDIVGIKIADSVTSIGKNAFGGCRELTEITIPDTVTNIGEGAFSWCDSLKTIKIPDGVEVISENTFEYCDRLETVQFSDKSKLKVIGDGAFSECSDLKSINIPNGVIKIGKYAFYSCDDLKSINIPNGVTNIGSGAFAYCHSLTGNIIIPGSVVEIGSEVFRGSDINNVIIEDGVPYIPYGMFNNCSYLNSISIPNSVKYIGDHAFAGCDDLMSITLPDNLESIGGWTFFLIDVDAVIYYRGNAYDEDTIYDVIPRKSN